ncbi:MAG: hypothetical protein U9R51_05250 [Actinomycetota bacterium]|nr:hypothetical protein [Actinomycetota bacterium]
MTDLHDRFTELDSVSPPDLWGRIEHIAAMQAPQRQTLKPGALIAVAASLLAVIVIGGPLLVIGSRATPDVEPNPQIVAAQRELTPVDVVWDDSIVDVHALPGGGFVAVATDPGRVFWSPDGVQWFDADPLEQVAPFVPPRGTMMEVRVLVATADHVLIRDEANTGIWIGSPKVGQWEMIPLDAGDLPNRISLLAIAANDSSVLVVGRSQGSDSFELDDPEGPLTIPITDRYIAWVIEPDSGAVDHHALPVGHAERAVSIDADANWYGGNWLVVLPREIWTDTEEGWETRTAVLQSPDGALWTVDDLPFSPTSVTCGSSSVIATECNFGGDTFWYSEDGLTWDTTTSAYLGHRSTYVDGLGFVAGYELPDGVQWVVSADGRVWNESAELGLTFERYPGEDTESITAVEHLFVFDSELWMWSIKEASP